MAFPECLKGLWSYQLPEKTIRIVIALSTSRRSIEGDLVEKQTCWIKIFSYLLL